MQRNCKFGRSDALDGVRFEKPEVLRRSARRRWQPFMAVMTAIRAGLGWRVPFG